MCFGTVQDSNLAWYLLWKSNSAIYLWFFLLFFYGSKVISQTPFRHHLLGQSLVGQSWLVASPDWWPVQMTSWTSDMSWLVWRRRTERCIMSKIREMVQEQPSDTRSCHYAFRTFHRLALITDLVQPIAETCDGAGLEFLAQFQMVLNEVATQLEVCIVQSCVNPHSPGGLLASLNDQADDSQNDLPLKDAPTPDNFVEALMSRSVSPYDLGHTLNSLQEIERAWVGSLVD